MDTRERALLERSKCLQSSWASCNEGLTELGDTEALMAISVGPRWPHMPTGMSKELY